MRKYDFDYSPQSDTLTVTFQPYEEGGKAEMGPYYSAAIYKKDGKVTMYKISGIQDILEAGGNLDFMEDVDVQGEILPEIKKERSEFESARPNRTPEEEEAYQIDLSKRSREALDILMNGMQDAPSKTQKNR